ncbi:hypothetical protein [Nocardia sp. NPDC004860]|uniref:hypothetical protein n=1 Tax=Nocardia sp. NPDC004860 TaxID=3154557 RepID=UPI0033A47DEE
MPVHKILSALAAATSSSAWMLTVFVAAIVLVTVSALLRAPRSDAREVYRAFATAFGFHRPAQPGGVVDDGGDDDSGKEQCPSEEAR